MRNGIVVRYRVAVNEIDVSIGIPSFSEPDDLLRTWSRGPALAVRVVADVNIVTEPVGIDTHARRLVTDRRGPPSAPATAEGAVPTRPRCTSIMPQRELAARRRYRPCARGWVIADMLFYRSCEIRVRA